MRFAPVVVLLFSSVSALAQATKPAKKLIEFGCDEPDTAFMKKHVAEMEKTPFDGTVFHIAYTNPRDGSKGSFMNECWGTRAFTEQELAASAEELRSTPF